MDAFHRATVDISVADQVTTFPTLQLRGPDDAGDRGTWIPMTSLDQYGATLARWFGVSEPGLDSVFPILENFSSRNVGFMNL